MECIEMHCKGVKETHHYGDPECDWVEVDGEVFARADQPI